MNSYHTFGLNIRSELPLPEVAIVKAPGDVNIRFANNLDQLISTSNDSGWRELTREQAILFLEGIGQFQIINGQEVIISPMKDVRESILRLCILGPVLGVVLYQRGYLVLHASVLEFDGIAVAFMGGSGWGKSSLAAALIERGHELISDDVTAVELRDESAIILPGLSRLKIDPEVAASLKIEADKLFLLDPVHRKKDMRVSTKGPIRRFSLKRIYVLDVNTTLNIKPLSSQDAVIEILRHSYPTRVNQPGDANHLLQCTQLVQRVSMARLHRTEDLSTLPTLAEMVEDDLVNDSWGDAK